MADPTNVLAVDDIQIATWLDCRVAVAADEDIEALIGRLNTLQSAVSEAIVEEDEDEEDWPRSTTCEVGAEDAPVIKLVYSILGQAVGRAPPTSTSSPARTRCVCASASTASCARPPRSRSGWSTR